MITITIDTKNLHASIEEARTYLDLLSSGSTQTTAPAEVCENQTEMKFDENQNEAPKKTTTKKKKTTAKKKKAAAMEVVEDEVDAVKVTVDDLRTILGDKVGEFREEIVEKLSEFGATSISTLDEDKYSEMHEFLTGL